MQALNSTAFRPSPLDPLRKTISHFPSRVTVRPLPRCLRVVFASAAPKREKNPYKRVIITGMGLVSVFGNDVDAYYEKLQVGESGIRHRSVRRLQIPHPIRRPDSGV
nr:3-oxoacyl-[acyl-carrier-protein] synthase I, chloroplastic [Ipomoea batatas]